MKKIEKRPIPEGFSAHPTVFAVGESYKIMIPTESEMLVGIRVGEEIFYDEYNGVKRTSNPVHGVEVPLDVLNTAKEYTVVIRRVLERRAYRSKVGEEECFSYRFFPVEDKGSIEIYHISDTHGRVRMAIDACEAAGGAPDILILNGDVMNSSETLDQIVDVYRIASEITGGQIPCVFSRGNHDFRGSYAEKLADYVPADNGNTYFTFRLGPIWGIVLDCGEDKFDDHYEYGHTVCCDAFRKRETRFLEKVCASGEYNAEGIRTRFLISHIPFAQRPGKGNYGYVDNPFLVGEELYTEWCAKIKECIRPNLMICGHNHSCSVHAVGGALDQRGQPAPVILGGKPKTLDGQRDGFSGAKIVLESGSASVTFNDNEGNTGESIKIEY